jgi:hypothetical protein
VTTLTRAQLAALTTLHRDGALSRAPQTHSATRRALLAASLASVGGGELVPAVDTWADAWGKWHATLPPGLGNPAAVGRAVIVGEIAARQGQPVRARLALDAYVNPDGTVHVMERP